MSESTPNDGRDDYHRALTEAYAEDALRQKQERTEAFREKVFLAALTGLCANETFFKASCGVTMDNNTPENLPSFFVDMATEVASAAIAARKEGQ